MTVEFDNSRAALTQARAARDAAQLAATQATARLKELQTARQRLARRTTTADRAALQQDTQAAEQEKAAATQVQALQAEAIGASQAADQALANFASYTDPRVNIGNLSSQSPFLLLPVRIETRFVSVPTEGGTAHQLWVRIYPDDCSIDTFEPTVAKGELANAQRYWERIWAAGGREGLERAAWRDLVGAHGSGRASWILEHYQPTNLAQKPAGAAATDEILVVGTKTQLSAAEATATATYWSSVWSGGDDLAKRQAARVALEAAVGAARAADIIAAYIPYNLADRPPLPLKRADVTVTTAFVVFPADPAVVQSSWTQAPRVKYLVDRFVVMGFTSGLPPLVSIGSVVNLPLIVGPDPSAAAADQIHPDGADLFVPDQLKWLTDFDEAVAKGVGLKIWLQNEQAAYAQRGFDRLLVLGVQLSASDADGKAALEELFEHHRDGRSGLSLVPQGSTTHNTPGGGSAYSDADDPDASFDDRQKASLFTHTGDPLRKQDGQWLAELLGIDPGVLARVRHSDGADQMRARAMQRVLWPATLGYWMDKMLTPVFNDDVVDAARQFFTTYVSGCGAMPPIRIGGQPYGILTTTAFSRISWLQPAPTMAARLGASGTSFLASLLGVLRLVDQDWAAMSKNVAYVGKPGDAHQTLLDIVGLQPSSVEFYSRYAESLTELFNVVNLWGFGPDFWKAFQQLALTLAGAQLLNRLGYVGPTEPDILKHVFLANADRITKVVDDRPLSETAPIRAYTDDGRNYIRWLIDAAMTSLDALNGEQGFSGNKTPTTLLYLYMRHALMLGYYDTSYVLHKRAGFLSTVDLEAMKPEPAFIHVAGRAESESRFVPLYKRESRITGDTTSTVADYITHQIGRITDTRHLFEQLDGLDILKDVPTSSLERLFAEHIDTCSYRLDAWWLGLVAYQLQALRYLPGEGEPYVQTGVYLGAYAWVEDLRPSPAALQPANLTADLAVDFGGSSPVLADPANGGYIHAPSLNHAKTAAVLRSGYLANASPANPSTLGVRLTSDRVRLALSLLEGIRNGQSFGALLGYRFERGLHDDHNLAEVDKFIYPLRKAFPLVADKLSTTQTGPDVPIEAIEARNVLDGLKLVTRVRSGGGANYPFGLPTLPNATAAEAAAIDGEVAAILDAYDAIADLALAEGVHQAVGGNFDRIAATLDAYTTGNFPPEPEVVRSPASGISLTHRVALHLETGLPAPAQPTPRSVAEPALDAWLAGVLPPLNTIGCRVTWKDPVSAAAFEQAVTLANLGMRPIDLLWLVKPDEGQAMTELDDRVLRFALTTATPRPDAELHILYMSGPPNTLSVFEAAPLLRNLRGLLGKARPLRATDAMLHNEASPGLDEGVFVDRARIAGPKSDLDTLSGDIGTFLGTLGPLVADPAANRTAILTGIDGSMDTAVSLLVRTASFSLPHAGWGFAFGWKHDAFRALLQKVGELVTRWNGKLADYDQQIATYDGLPAGTSDAERFKRLQAAEILISTRLTPLPATPALLRAALDLKRAAFVAKRDALVAVRDTASGSFANVVASARALLPITDFDSLPFDLAPFEDQAIAFAKDLATNLTGHRDAIDQRRSAVQARLDAHDAAASASAKVEALQGAAKLLLGDDFQVIPEYSLGKAQADEWTNALAAATSGTLTDYLINTLKVDFPVDEWLYGVARVRPNEHAWEQVVMLAEAFGKPPPALTPIQLPYEAGAPWVAMQFPSAYTLDADRLLYTAHYSSAFDGTSRQCGLLLDEWTEVVPANDRTTGLAFNFDRPDNEAPQAMLLITPASVGETWQWDDLVGALTETLDLAKKRAVEPVHVDDTPYSRFLPATVMAATTYGITISTALAAASGTFETLGGGGNA
jgi:hypothetical protein